MRKPERGMWDFFVEHGNAGVKPGAGSAEGQCSNPLSLLVPRPAREESLTSGACLGCCRSTAGSVCSVSSGRTDEGLAERCRAFLRSNPAVGRTSTSHGLSDFMP